jgi:DNA polymerase-3 subunit beta
MNVKCNRSALHEAVQLASSIVPSRTPKPILTCAKLQASKQDQKLTVTATDNEISVKSVVPQVQVNADGAAVVPADRIAAILHESADETVELEATEANLQVVGRDSRFRIYGHDPEDFPVVAKVKQENALKIKAGLLKRMIQVTAFAAARENTRYAINGVLWEQQGKKLRMVATDGRRLAQVDGDVIPEKKDAESTTIVPIKTMTILERILHDPEEEVQIVFSSNQLCVSTALVELSSNLVQGRFPKYADVIPTDTNKKIQLESETLRSAVRRAALLTNEQSRGVQLEFTQDKLCLSSSTPEAGDAEINMQISYQGEALKIGFNPQYLLEMLRVINEPEVVCELSDGAKPGIIRAGKDFLYVIMPVTV